MQKRTVRAGRPTGSTTFDASIARALGECVRTLRTEAGISQEALAYSAGIERSYMGKIERGQHLPSLVIVMKIARALGCRSAELMAAVDTQVLDAEIPAKPGTTGKDT